MDSPPKHIISHHQKRSRPRQQAARHSEEEKCTNLPEYPENLENPTKHGEPNPKPKSSIEENDILKDVRSHIVEAVIKIDRRYNYINIYLHEKYINV